jgi:hypothetical protein
MACSGGQNDLTKAGMKGKVKMIREVQCDATYQDNKWVAGKPLTGDQRVLIYDENGLFVESYALTEKGDTLGKSTVKRENGDIVEEIYFSRFMLNPQESKLFKTSRTMLERVSENQMNFEIWEGNRLLRQGANYHDSKGRMLRQVQVVSDREVTIHYVYEKNLLTEHYQEEENGERSATQLYDYDGFDKEGNWTMKLIYRGNEKIKPDLVIKRELKYY